MHILIVAATSFEIQPTVELIQKSTKKFQSHEISSLITGVGMVATTYSLTKIIHEKRPDIILQAGIAGCFTNHDLTESLIIKEDSFGDLGVTENNFFKNIFDLNLADKNNYPFSNGMLMNPNNKLLSILPLEKVSSISINEITTSKEKIEWYKQNSFPTVESMEGAAFHYVCLLEKIPFLQIRSISNYIGERDKSKWKLKESIESLNEKLILLIEEISKHDEAYFRI
jgi:futalosine hydrolase